LISRMLRYYWVQQRSYRSSSISLGYAPLGGVLSISRRRPNGLLQSPMVHSNSSFSLSELFGRVATLDSQTVAARVHIDDYSLVSLTTCYVRRCRRPSRCSKVELFTTSYRESTRQNKFQHSLPSPECHSSAASWTT